MMTFGVFSVHSKTICVQRNPHPSVRILHTGFARISWCKFISALSASRGTISGKACMASMSAASLSACLYRGRRSVMSS